MRVTNNSFHNALIPQIQNLNEQQVKLQNQLSTGQRIEDPSDDPASMGRVLKIQSEKRELTQYQRNISRVDSVANFSFEMMQTLQELNQRASETSFKASTITGDESYRAFALEVNEILEQAFDTGNSKYLDDHVFSGSAFDTPPYTATRDVDGNITAITYAGSSATPEVYVSETSKVEPLTDATTNQQISDFMNNLVGLRDALESLDPANVTTAQQNVFADEDNLVINLSDIGSKLLRVSVAETQAEERFFELESRLSEEVDVDFAETLVNLTTTQNAYQAALSSSARVLNLSILNYI